MNIRKQDNAAVASELRITGVPQLQHEDLYELFKNLCTTVNIQPLPIKSIFRVGNRNNGKNLDSTIMIKLFSPYDKNFLLRSINEFKKFIKTNLKLSHIGINNDDKNFFVNENLTKANYLIFKHATQLRSQNKLKSVFTRRGLVFIKLDSDTDPIHVQTLDNFHALFRH